MSSQIVLIDLENVQADALQRLASEYVRVLLFVGANQTKLPIETVLAMHQLGARAEYVQISGSGRNALDFHIAYYLGVLSAEKPTFHVVSKDTGFEPLIQHLKNLQISVNQAQSIRDLPQVKDAPSDSVVERIQIAGDKLGQPQVTKPGTLKTLSNWIVALNRQPLSEEEVAAVVAGLAERGLISVDGTKVAYPTTTGA